MSKNTNETGSAKEGAGVEEMRRRSVGEALLATMLPAESPQRTVNVQEERIIQ